MATFPTSIPAYAGFTSSHTLATDSHAAQHNAEQGDITAIATKVGTGSSTPAAGKVLRSTGPNVSSWGPVDLTTDVTGVLPQANGGTGTTGSTGTGSAVYQTSPTIVTPTIAGFTSAQHNHQNATGGGTLAANAVPALDLSLQTLSNPHKFNVYRNAAQNAGNGAFAVLQCDTKVFDTGSDVDIVTNKGRFTAPVAGFYQFNGAARAILNGTAQFGIALFKNGLQVTDGNVLSSTAFSNTFATTVVVSNLLQLAAGEYVEVQVIGSSAFALTVGAVYENFFSGFLVSTT